MATHRRRIHTRNPSIYSHYAPPQQHVQHHEIAKKSAPRNGPTIVLVGFVLFIIFILGSITYANFSQHNGSGFFGLASKSTSITSQKLATNVCSENVQSKELVVIKSKYHMWACSQNTVVHDAPVVVGMENYAADKTPVGTFRIEQKQQDIPLTGADSTGSWNVQVNYWLQFLQNQYGRYGFHDAWRWRKDTEYGHTSMYSSKASKGCVEAPLADMKWIYYWAPVGTTVVIKA